MKYTGPKVKRSRSLGIAITPKAAKVMEKKPYPPGEHGRNSSNGKRRESDYKLQLLEKQRLRAQYNVHERQMKNYYRKARKMKGNTPANLITLLESRLDALVLHGGLATTIYAARQFVNHGHIKVNGRKVDIPSYLVKPGDVISVKEKSQNLSVFIEAGENPHPPEYLTFSAKDMSITFERLPERHEIPIICELSKVIEYYSH
jgi:small subunit ribosomal protein S4